MLAEVAGPTAWVRCCLRTASDHGSREIKVNTTMNCGSLGTVSRSSDGSHPSGALIAVRSPCRFARVPGKVGRDGSRHSEREGLERRPGGSLGHVRDGQEPP